MPIVIWSLRVLAHVARAPVRPNDCSLDREQSFPSDASSDGRDGCHPGPRLPPRRQCTVIIHIIQGQTLAQLIVTGYRNLNSGADLSVAGPSVGGSGMSSRSTYTLSTSPTFNYRLLRKPPWETTFWLGAAARPRTVTPTSRRGASKRKRAANPVSVFKSGLRAPLTSLLRATTNGVGPRNEKRAHPKVRPCFGRRTLTSPLRTSRP
jgi:hypothetical protein